jgi:bacteriocin biosynthesis cyclodehydratase domain-containing protein
VSGPRYRLRSSADAITGSEGELYLVRAGDDDLVVRDAEPADHRILALLASAEPTVAELARAAGVDERTASGKLAALVDTGAVVAAAASPALPDADAQRYSRQLPYLGDLGDARELQRRLSRARVAVVGCGGLGAWTIAALAGAGVRHLRIVDDDVVELSNLNRQLLYTPSQVGVAKTEATASWLRAFDEQVEIEALDRRVDGPAAADAVVRGMDALVLAADSPPYQLARWINAACLRHAVPFIAAGQLPPLLKIGPLYVPGHSGCFTCHERALRHGSVDYDAYVRHVRSTPVRGATLGPASGIVGAMIAMELVHFLIGVTPATAGAALLVDLRTMEIRRDPVQRDGTCPDCRHDL